MIMCNITGMCSELDVTVKRTTVAKFERNVMKKKIRIRHCLHVEYVENTIPGTENTYTVGNNDGERSMRLVQNGRSIWCLEIRNT